MMRELWPRTVRPRLAALIVASSTAVLALSGCMVYEALRSRIEASAAAEINATLSALDAHLQQVRTVEDVRYLADKWGDLLHGHANLSLAIDDAKGTRILSTPGFLHHACSDALSSPPAPGIAKPVTPDTHPAWLRSRIEAVPLAADNRTNTTVRVSV